MNTPKERPILFSAPMVRAILDGKKTQARRLAKGEGWVVAIQETAPADSLGKVCPYGAPGERLWVREQHRFVDFSHLDGRVTFAVEYADHERLYRTEGMEALDRRTGNRPSIHMPRWASRLLLEVVSVRVERLQQISEEDAIAEGMEPVVRSDDPYVAQPSSVFPKAKFQELWNHINGKTAPWASNPFVWVVEFKRVTLSTRTITDYHRAACKAMKAIDRLREAVTKCQPQALPTPDLLAGLVEIETELLFYTEEKEPTL